MTHRVLKSWKQCVCPSRYHLNDFVATHVLGHMMYVIYTEHPYRV